MQKFMAVARGQKKEKPLWKVCARMVGFTNGRSTGLNLAAASLYVKRTFKPVAKVSMETMVKNLKKVFRDGIHQFDYNSSIFLHLFCSI
jgi:predicted metalloendopeptidase